MHTTALIHEKKQSLLTSHAFQGFLDIIVVILLEIFLAIISLPLYIVTKPTEGKKFAGGKEYKMRRVITLTTLTIVIIIWLLKLSFIGISWYYFDQRTTFEVQQLPVEELTQTDIVTEFAFSDEGSSLVAPVIVDVIQGASNTLILSGDDKAGSNVMLYLSGENYKDSKLLWNIYTTTTGPGGNWEIIQDRDISYLPPGEYIVVAVTFDDVTGQRSSVSNVVSFEIKQTFLQKVFERSDIYLNMLMIIFLVLGAFLITLTV